MKANFLLIIVIFLLNVSTYAQWDYVHNDQQNEFFSIKFLTEDTGYFSGEERFVSTSDGGRYLTTINHFYGYDVLSIDFLNQTDGVAVGRYYYLGPGFIFQTTDGGQNWNPAYNDFVSSVNDVFLLDNEHGWAVGDGGNIFKTYPNMNWWTYVASGPTDLNAVFFINQNTGWAVGWGKIIKSTDGGDTWFELQTGVNSKFNDVFFINENNGWVTANDNNSLLHTTDGGNIWSVTNLSTVLSKVLFFSDSVGFIAGSGKIL